MRPLKEHDEDEQEDPEYEYSNKWRIPIGFPARRRASVEAGDVLAEAEAVVREYIEAEAVAGIREPIRAAAAEVKQRWTLDDPVITNEQLRALLALALESALVVGASALLAKGLGSSSSVVSTLEGQLSTLFKRRSMMRAKGAPGLGFTENWTEVIQTLATESGN